MKDVDFIHSWQISEIHNLSLPSDWRYIPGELNPADDFYARNENRSYSPYYVSMAT